MIRIYITVIIAITIAYVCGVIVGKKKTQDIEIVEGITMYAEDGKIEGSLLLKDEPQVEMNPELIDKPIGYEVISVEGTLNMEDK